MGIGMVGANCVRPRQHRRGRCPHRPVNNPSVFLLRKNPPPRLRRRRMSNTMGGYQGRCVSVGAGVPDRPSSRLPPHPRRHRRGRCPHRPIVSPCRLRRHPPFRQGGAGRRGRRPLRVLSNLGGTVGADIIRPLRSATTSSTAVRRSPFPSRGRLPRSVNS